MTEIKIKDIQIEVLRKKIKNLHLTVHPPHGHTRISAPEEMDLDTVRVFALSKLDWIKQQKKKFKKQERESPKEYINKESHYFRGKRYLLKVLEQPVKKAQAYLHNNKIVLAVNPETPTEKRKALLNAWYRQNLKEEIPNIISKWEPRLKVKVKEFGVKKMKTKWGTCNPAAGRIWLNLELAKKPPACLEYIVVHEMAHLIEKSHNHRFIKILDKHLPQWQELRSELNRLAISYTPS